MEYTLGRARGRLDGRRSEEIDPEMAAAILKTVQRYREDTWKLVAPVVEAVANLQPVVDSFQHSLASIADTLAFLCEHAPQNWPPSPDGLDFDPFDLVLSEGIPLAFVPGRDTVAALIEAPHYEARLDVLVHRMEEVIVECRAELERQSLHPTVAGLRPLVDESLAALESAHFASAQALAVCVSDTLLHTTWNMRKYSKMLTAIQSTDLDEAFYRGSYRYALALQPAISFLTPWNSLSGETLPRRLSRHATVHGACVEHLTMGNAIIAVMFAASLLLGVSEWNRVSKRLEPIS